MKTSEWRGYLLLPLLLLALAGALAPVGPAAAQVESGEAAEATPWLYENSDVPVDRSWTFGKLDNGLRYAVKQNGVPPGQVSVRVRIDAGSLMEADDERGFAHFLEHLAFRGSRHVPDGEAKRIWQRFGVSFGSDSNASTTPTQTVYQLDLPNASRERLDESMKIIAGMIRAPNIDAAALDAERPVILAELREELGPQFKVNEATRALFFRGQPLAERSPIGTAETLAAARPEKLKSFHRRWYRPENTVLVIAGDGDPALFEYLIATHFGDWRPSGPPPEPPDFGRPVAGGPVSQVLVEPTSPTFLTLFTGRPWQQVADTIEYNQQLMVDMLAIQLINRRLETRARAGGSFLHAEVSQDDISRSADATFVSIIPTEDDWRAALGDVRAVIADALETPPSKEDLERELAEFEAAFTIGVESYPFESAAKQADEIVKAVDIRETVAAPQDALDIFRKTRPLFTPERVHDATRDLFAGVAQRALLVAPDAAIGNARQLELALAEPVKPDPSARLAQGTIGFDALPDLGEPGTLAAGTSLPELEMEQLILSNGVRALLYPNDAESDKIHVRVRFGRGYQAFPSNSESLIWSGPMALVESGVGDLGLDDLDRLRNGKRIGMSFSIDNDAFELSAETRPADLAGQLHLLAAKLARPRWDPAPLRRAKAAARIAYASFEASAASVLERDLKWLLRNRDPRWKTPTPEDLDELTAETFRATWEPVLASGPIEVLMFGDFERDVAVEALLRTFGALPPREPAAKAMTGDMLAFPDHRADPLVLRHRGDSDQAAALIAWPTGGGIDDVRESRHLEVLARVFSDRLFDRLRSQEGTSYAPQVSNSWPLDFDSGGYIIAMSQLPAGTDARFFELAREIADDLAARPIDADELRRVTEPLRQIIARAVTGNTFWLSQLEGASYTPEKFHALRSIFGDYTRVSPADIQALARKYLRFDKSWSMVVAPRRGQAASD